MYTLGVVYTLSIGKKERETGLTFLTDEELARLARDRNAPKAERRKAVAEEKYRRLRNKSKREG